MPTAVETFFLDTNVLLHCVWLDHPPWKDLTGHDPVRLIVALNVVEEIDAKGAIECEIQGTNIRQPVIELIPVTFKFVETETLPVAEDLLKGRIFGRG